MVFALANLFPLLKVSILDQSVTVLYIGVMFIILERSIIRNITGVEKKSQIGLFLYLVGYDKLRTIIFYKT